MDQNYKYDVFISYSRKDTAVAEKIVKAFGKAGITYFIDEQGIGGGLEFPAVLAEAIRNSRVFLFLASRNSYQSKFTQSEIVYAFNKKRKDEIIPYIIDDSDLPEELAFTFSAINWRRMAKHPVDTVLVNDILQKVKRSKDSDASQELVDNQQEQIVASPQNALNKATSFFSKFNGKTLAIVVLALSIIFLLITLLAPGSFIHDHYSVFENIGMVSLVIIFGCTVIGLIRPASLCLNNRSEVAKFYATALLISFISIGTMADHNPIMDNIDTVDSTEQVIQAPQDTNTINPKD